MADLGHVFTTLKLNLVGVVALALPAGAGLPALRARCAHLFHSAAGQKSSVGAAGPRYYIVYAGAFSRSGVATNVARLHERTGAADARSSLVLRLGLSPGRPGLAADRV